MHKLEKLMDAHDYLLLDGAMGTMLFAAGLENGAPPEAWNFAFPDRIQTIHRHYIAAGSQVILTNTFGGTRNRLKLHDLQEQTMALNRVAAELAREVAGAADRPVVVAGSVGPTGDLLAPLGTMTEDEAVAAFAEQAQGLIAGGVDVIWIETMSDLNEVRTAVAGARQVSDTIPILATMSFDTNGRTMMGVTAAQAAQELGRWGLFAVGANCGNNLADTEAAVQAMHQADPQLRLISKANAGIPHWEGADLIYDGTPAVMADHTQRARAAGARLIGACCGSTADHLQAMAAALTQPILSTDQPPRPAGEPEATNGQQPPVRKRKRRRQRSRER